MQTIIENLLTVVGNIPGIDEAVYSNIYDFEQTDKTVFVIIPGDISENITAYLVNGSILLMSKVMLVLKSKYIETNMVITSKDNIKEFVMDNCSGVYNVIKYKLIYNREDCGDSYEGMFVKSVNGLHGEVFLDIPLKISDLPNDAGYITEEDLPDYSDKFNEIDTSISDVSTRVKDIEDDYTTREYVDLKISEIVIEVGVKSINGMTGDVSLFIPEKVSDLTQDIDYITEEDADSKYMQKGDVPTDVYTKNEIDNKFTDSSTYNKNTFATKTELNSSINNVSTYISNTYVKKSDVPTFDTYTKSEIDEKDSDVLTQAKSYTEQEVLELSDYVDSTFATKEEIPADYVKIADYNKFVSDLATVDSTQNDSIAANTQDIADINTNITNVEADVKEIEDLLEDVNDVIKSNIPSTYSLDEETKKLPENILDLIDYRNLVIDETYARKEDIPVIPDYTLKFAEIDSSISDVSARVKSIEDDYVKSDYLEDRISDISSAISKGVSSANEYTDGQIEYLDTDISSKFSKFNASVNNEINRIWEKENSQDDDISDIKNFIDDVPETYLKIKDLPDYTDEFTEIDSSISDVSTRVKSIEDAGYVTDSEVDKKIEDIEFPVTSVNGMTGEVVIKTTSTDYVDLQIKNVSTYVEDNFAKKTDIPDYTDKFTEIDSSIDDISTRVNSNAENIASVDTKIDDAIERIDGEIGSHTEEINSVSGRVSAIEDDYVKSDDIKDFITELDLPDYTDKFNEIDANIGDLQGRAQTNADNISNLDSKTNYIETDYKTADEALDGKIEVNAAEINSVSGRVQAIEDDYVKSDDIKDFITAEDLPDYTDKFTEIDTNISGLQDRVQTNADNISNLDSKTNDIEGSVETLENTVSDHSSNIQSINESIVEINTNIEDFGSRINDIESDYVKHEELPIVPDYTDKFNEIDSSIDDISTRLSDNYVTNSSVSINYATKDELEEIRLFKFPNATIIGSPKIDNGQISEFSLNDYLEFPFMVDFRDRGFEINFHIYTGSDVISQQNILDSEYGLAFAVRNSHFVMAVSSNGTSWNLGEIIGTNTIVPNRNYYVKISYDRFTYKIEYKEDITGDYITDATKVVASQGPYPKQMFIGVGGVYASSKNFFTGMINLNYANLKINNELVWQGMDDVGLATRMAVDMSNIDAAGEQKLKNIIATEGYIKELPDYYATKDELNTSIANVSSWVSSNYAKKSSLDDYLLISDAQNTYAGKTAFNALYTHVTDELDSEITDLYKADQEINGKIDNINDYISTVNSSVNALETAGYLTKISADGYYVPKVGNTYLDKASTSKNELNGVLQVGNYTTNLANAYLHVRQVSSPITGKKVNGACFSVNGDGTASFLHKTYNDDGTGAKNSAVLRFSNQGIQFAINSGSSASPTEDMYKELLTEDSLSNYVTTELLNAKQDILVSGTNIKTINGEDILGEGNIVIQGGGGDLSNYYTKSETEGLIAVKQDILVSGTNIKTINNQSILGEGNIQIQGGGVDELYVNDKITDLSTYINNVYTTKEYVDDLVGDINTVLESI